MDVGDCEREGVTEGGQSCAEEGSGVRSRRPLSMRAISASEYPSSDKVDDHAGGIPWKLKKGHWTAPEHEGMMNEIRNLWERTHHQCGYGAISARVCVCVRVWVNEHSTRAARKKKQRR